MTKLLVTTLGIAGALALSACGSSEQADYEAASDNVEIPASDAMEGVTEAPVAAAAATAPAAVPTEGEDAGKTAVEAEAEASAEGAQATVDDIEALTKGAATKAADKAQKAGAADQGAE